MSFPNVLTAQTKQLNDSLKVILIEQTYKEVRIEIDKIEDLTKKIKLKKELGDLMREARKPED